MKEVDLLIITALPKELNAVLNLKEGGREVWEQEQTPEKHIYYLTDLPLSNGASFKIAALAQWQMGPTAAAIVVSSILNLIKTKMISLVGICAGWRQKNVGLGDVIVASQAFFYDVGKMKEGRLSPEMQSYQVHPHIQQWLQDFIESNRSWIATIKTPRPLSFRYQKEYLLYKIAESQNYDWIRAEETTKNCPDWSEVIPYLEKAGLITKKLTLTPEGEEYLSDLKIRKRQFAPEPDSPEPKAHYGSFASGNSVIEDRFIFDELAERDRKILALEMEAASFLRACYAKDSSLVAFVVKGVCDYADSEKADNFHRYSAEAAARFMVAFAAEALPRIRSQQDKTDPSTAKPTETDESETIKILFLAANPSDTDPLKLDEEVRLIDEKLRLSKYRDRFDIKQHWAVRVGDIQSLLLRHQPHIVHFSGHGSKAGEIILKDGLGNSGYVPVEALKNLFSILKDNIRCVVLNACYSEEQARAIAQHIDCVVGMSKSILDTSAINFAASFYQGLGYGRTIKESFDLGCNQIGLSGIDASGSKTRQFDLDSEQTGQDRLKEQDRPKLLALDERSKNIRFVSQNGGTRKPSARSTEETNKESPYQGKYIINIQSANNVHIGDRISEPITIESKEIKSSEKVLFSWIHLSDLYFGQGDNHNKYHKSIVLQELRKDIEKRIKSLNFAINAVIVTGDIAEKASKADYETAVEEFSKLSTVLKIAHGSFFFVPGNHDVDRNIYSQDRDVSRMIKALREGERIDDALGDNSDREKLERLQQNYFTFVKDFSSDEPSKLDQLFWSHQIDIEKAKVRLVGLNSVLLSQDHNDKGKLQVGLTQIHKGFIEKPIEENEIVIALSHHPFDQVDNGFWLSDGMEMLAQLRKYADIHLCGHIHESIIEQVSQSSGQNFVRIVAGSTHTKQETKYSYNIASIVDKSGQLFLRIWPYTWLKEINSFRLNPVSVPEGEQFCELALKKKLQH